MEISLPVTLAVLGAALLHALWNAMLKAGPDKQLEAIGLAAGSGAVALVAVPFLGAPARESWPWIAGSATVHIAYFWLLAGAYRWGDMSFAYPIIRGGGEVIARLRPRQRGGDRRLHADRRQGRAARGRAGRLRALVLRRQRRGDHRGGDAAARARSAAAFPAPLGDHVRRRRARRGRLRHRALGDDARAGGAGGGAARDLGGVRRGPRRSLPQGAVYGAPRRSDARGARGARGVENLKKGVRPPKKKKPGSDPLLRPHVREEDHVPDRGAVGEQHHQAVHAQARARRGRQPHFQRADVVGVVVHRLHVPGRLLRRLLAEALGLVLGIVQLGEAVGDFLRVDEELEALGEPRVRVLAPRERRDFRREVEHEGRLGT